MAASGQNTLERIPKVWQSIQPSYIRRTQIVTRPEYQPRNPSAISGNVARFRHTQVLVAMVDQMCDFLRASPENHTEALWLVELEGQLVVVDGHHRLQAYTRCRRPELPAKVYQGKNAKNFAALSSRLANVCGSRVQLHRAEIREAVWQTLRELTSNGSHSWQEVSDDGRRYSYRNIQSQFGGQPALGTIQKMCSQLPRVRQSYLPEEKEWPSWNQYRAWLRNKHLKEKPKEMIDKWQRVEHLAERLARMLEKYEPEIRCGAYVRAEEILGELREADLRDLGIQLDGPPDF